MSELIVQVCKIDKIENHSGADSLDLCQIKGWQCVIPKGKYKQNDLVVYIPIDSLIPIELSECLGITKYLKNGRVGCCKLRGEPSFGVVVENEQNWPEGTDVKDFYKITRYVSPVVLRNGDAENPHPLFVKFTEVENMRNFPNIFQNGEEVICSEKAHGSNSRVSSINQELMAGSMEVRRKRPEDFSTNIYWYPLSLPPVRNLIESLGANHKQVILYGEIYGSKIQTLHYGKIDQLGYLAFGLFIDGKFLDFDEFEGFCKSFGVPTVPTLYRGPFSLEKVIELSKGNTLLMPQNPHIKEGVVVLPIKEKNDPKIGRVCLKYIGDQYLLAKGISDTNDV